jgi:hypothetical protein
VRHHHPVQEGKQICSLRHDVGVAGFSS